MLLILRGISFSQDNTITNISVIDNLIDESLVPFGNKLLLLGEGNFYELITDKDDEQHLYLIESIRRKFNSYKILINENSDSTDFQIIIKNPKIEVRYNNFFTDKLLGTKQVAREVLVSYDLELTDKKKSLTLYKANIKKNTKNNFGLDKLSLIEDGRYSFSVSTLPEENSFNKFLFPAIIIASSAAAIILFFTIRSK